MTLQTPTGAAQTLTIDAAGARIAVSRWGAGPALLCLHAIGHGARDFAKLGARLGGRFSVIALDFPGHGGSPREDAPPTAARYAEIIAGAVQALGLTRVLVLGNSIGGAAALRYAVAAPERVQGLILCNSGGLQPVGLLARLVCGHYARFFAKGERREPGYAKAYRRYYERIVLPASEAAWRREEIIADADKTAPLLRAAWENFTRPESDVRALPGKLSCPVLYVWAKGDGINAWSRSKRAARTARHHMVRLLPGGHAAFLESPEAFDAAIDEFEVWRRGLTASVLTDETRV